MDRTGQIKLWRKEAKAWILAEGAEFVRMSHDDMPRNPEITIGQIVNHLDNLAPVPGYELLRPDNQLRYQVVRNVIEQAAKEGMFETGLTVNSKGRGSKCFSPAGWVPAKPERPRRPSFDVLVDGPDAEVTSAKLTEWLENNHITVDSLYVEMVKDTERKAS